MHLFRSRRLVSVVIVCAIGVVAACGGDDTSTPGVTSGAEEVVTDTGDVSGTDAAAPSPAGPTGRLVIGSQFLDEYTGSGVLGGFQSPPAYGSVIGKLLFDGLMELDPTQGYSPVPDLAESLVVSDDGLEYTFDLRDNVTWHDGTPFTSADVVFTIDAVRDPANGARNAADLVAVSSVSAPDPDTVVVQLSRPFAPILQSLSIPIHPAHLLGAELASGTALPETDYARAPIGTGPFRWGEYREGEQLLLDANTDYFKGAPKIAEVVVVAVADYDAAAARLAAGEIDVSEVQGAQLGLIDGIDGYSVNSVPSTNVYAIALNVSDPLLADPRVRIALNQLVDRQTLIDTLEGGQGSPALTPLVNTSVETDSGASLATDPDAAAELLTDAGWVRTDDGTWTVDGEPVALTLHDGFAPQMAEIVASSWRDQGIDVNVVVDDYSTIFGGLFADPSAYQALTYSFGSPTDPDSVYIVFHSAATLANGGFNAFGYSNPDVDEALDAGRTELTPDGRAAAYARFQEAVAADPAYVMLYTSPVHLVINDDVTGWTAGIVEYQFVRFLWWNVHEWVKAA